MPARKKPQSEIKRGVNVSMSRDDEMIVEFVCNHDKKTVAEKVRQLFRARSNEIIEELDNDRS